jgi:DNA-binding NtrC family response regulator
MGRPEPLLVPEVKKPLLDYAYPGNVRELTNIVERLVVICSNGNIDCHDLPQEIREETANEQGPTTLLKELPNSGVPLQELEKELILKTLKMTSWNKAAAARKLGMTRRLLYLRLAEYGLSVP